MTTEELIERVLKGDRVAVSKSITALENLDPAAIELLRRLFPHTGKAFVIGITGPPGTGKSSLVDQLTKVYRSRGSKVAILAVDPTSPVSGGAILGDRVRMIDHALDPGVYIRSMASRGDEGGLSRSARNAIRVLDAAGNNVVFVETVGSGQAEVDIVRVADIVVVVLMPELGDEVQAAKAGLMEVGDIFVINKSDLPGADRVVYNLQSILTTKDNWTQTSIKVSAKSGQGINDLISIMERYRTQFATSKVTETRRLGNLSQEIIRNVEYALSADARAYLIDSPKLSEILARVSERRIDPESATRELLEDVERNLWNGSADRGQVGKRKRSVSTFK